jgi:hypothetical protein
MVYVELAWSRAFPWFLKEVSRQGPVEEEGEFPGGGYESTGSPLQYILST